MATKKEFCEEPFPLLSSLPHMVICEDVADHDEPHNHMLIVDAGTEQEKLFQLTWEEEDAR